LLMFFCPPGRDDSDALTALGVGYMEEHPLAHAEPVNPLLTVVFAFVDGLSKHPPAKPGALEHWPLKAAGGVADAAPGSGGH
jgi:hypothetical protein